MPNDTTRRVRILIVIDSHAKWVSAGHCCGDDVDPKDWIVIDELKGVTTYSTPPVPERAVAAIVSSWRWVEIDVPLPASGDTGRRG